MKEYIGVVNGVICSVLCYLFGKIDIALKILVLAMVFDYITGMINAFIHKKLDSRIGLNGFFKKIIILIIISLAYQVDLLTNANDLIRNFVMYYYIANEGLSILENCSKMGVPIPNIIKNTLEQIREENDK